MYFFRTSLATSSGPVELAFTDRHGGVSAAVLDDFGPGDELCDLHQVHGGVVDIVAPPATSSTIRTSGDRPDADSMVTGTAGLSLMVRTADCVPVLLVDPGVGLIGAVHCGRLGLVAGIVPNTVAVMQELGATSLTAWLGPHICGGCYEVPREMREAVASVVPESHAETSRGTPSLDLGAGVRTQLKREGVTVVDVSTCTRESADLFSHRREGAAAGRQAGLIRIRTSEVGAP